MRQKQQIDKIILDAFQEDMHNGDVTADTLLTDLDRSHGFLVAKESGVVAGLEVFARVFQLLEGEVNLTLHKKDGDLVTNQDIIGEIEGVSKTILKGERTALNILQKNEWYSHHDLYNDKSNKRGQKQDLWTQEKQPLI